MGNTLKNCVSSPEENNEGSHASLLRENSEQANQPGQQQNGPGRLRASQSQQQRYFLSPETSRRVDELSEDEQVKIAKRIGLIGYLPIRFFMVRDNKDEERECVICMVEYENGDELRYLPCAHSFHKTCIDAWLMRSFTCPNCSQQVDSALVGSFDPLGGGGGGVGSRGVGAGASAAAARESEEVELQVAAVDSPQPEEEQPPLPTPSPPPPQAD